MIRVHVYGIAIIETICIIKYYVLLSVLDYYYIVLDLEERPTSFKYYYY